MFAKFADISCRLSGSDDDCKHLMELRKNIVHYITFIDTFAPCLVGNSKWNNTMQDQRVGPSSFNELLSTSDETFLVLVILNYAPRWYAEVVKKDATNNEVCKEMVSGNVMFSG
jgi:hypothetical protein